MVEERRSKAERVLLALSGGYGASAVGLGAYGAHGLDRALAGLPDAATRLGWWETAVLYHLAHALALGLCAWMAARAPKGAAIAGGAFALGVLLFAGTLYAMALGAPRWLGAVTPLGGLSLIAGWLAVLLCALRRGR